MRISKKVTPAESNLKKRVGGERKGGVTLQTAAIQSQRGISSRSLGGVGFRFKESINLANIIWGLNSCKMAEKQSQSGFQLYYRGKFDTLSVKKVKSGSLAQQYIYVIILHRSLPECHQKRIEPNHWTISGRSIHDCDGGAKAEATPLY